MRSDPKTFKVFGVQREMNIEDSKTRLDQEDSVKNGSPSHLMSTKDHQNRCQMLV
jgi:hypothetical protein